MKSNEQDEMVDFDLEDTAAFSNKIGKFGHRISEEDRGSMFNSYQQKNSSLFD